MQKTHSETQLSSTCIVIGRFENIAYLLLSCALSSQQFNFPPLHHLRCVVSVAHYEADSSHVLASVLTLQSVPAHTMTHQT